MEFYIKIKHFDLERTLFCGQAFRYMRLENNKSEKYTEGKYTYLGIVGNRLIKLRQEEDGVTFLNITDNDLPFWLEYFDIDTDYAALTKSFSVDSTLRKACEFAYGIRLLKQEPFETLISFIISQNNNIPRITGIISRLCECFGDKLSILDTDNSDINAENINLYGFPSAERLSGLTIEELAPLRAGFRARYIIDAAKKVQNGTVELNSLYNMDAVDAKKELMKITGVGDKVADCVLLFAYRKTESVPKDVWIKRVMTEFYPNGLPECVGVNSGIAQQYLFEYIRNRDK